jgi:STE24 endopeptidase
MTLPRQFALLLATLLVVGVAPTTAQGAQVALGRAPAVWAPTVMQSTPQPTTESTPQLGPQSAAQTQQAYTLPPEKLAKAIALSRIRDTLAITEGIWGIVFLWLLLSAGTWSRIEGWAQRRAKHRWVQGVLFFFAFFILTTVASLPFDMYGQHASRSYGVSVQTWPSWWSDQAKSLGVALVIGTLVLLLFNWIVRRWPRRYWVGVWVATVPIIILLIFLSPLIIDPLFNQFEPLELHHAPLVAKLERVVQRTGIDIPPNRMFLMKASKKYNGINAYVTGIGASKRYVMWDTATDRMPDDEVLFVFGHESGHYVLHHIPQMIAGIAVGLFFVYWACATFAAWLVQRFGPGWGTTELSSRTGFVVLLFVVSVAGFVLQPATNAFSRHFEHQADVFGQEAIHGIVADPQKTAMSAFNQLGEAWLEDPKPNAFIEFWLYNHPSVQRRAQFAAQYNPWANGGHGEFFTK